MIPNSKKIYLCAPDLSKLYILNGVQTSTVDFHPQVKGYSELSFEVDRFLSINGEFVESNGYEELKPYMYLYLEDIGYFIMDPPEIQYDGNQEIKSVSAYSAEREFENRDWVGIKINYGTADSMEYSNTDEYNKDEYGFANRYVTMYDATDDNLSFLTQILKKVSSKWSIGYIAPELVNAKIPFMEIDSENLYAVMTSEVAPRLQCLFIFDYLHFTINVFHKDYIDQSFDLDTGIYIGFRNLENNVSVSVDSDSIYTRFSVQGQDNLEFRDVNYGDNTIINMDYFLCDPYMDDAMIQKYRMWQSFRANHIDEYKALAKQYNELVEKREERTYRVPSDESYWTNWQNINTEGLMANLNYFRQEIELLQISVEEREPEEYLDEDGNYSPLLIDGGRLYKIEGLTEGTQYIIISTDQIVTVVRDANDVTAESISISTATLSHFEIEPVVDNMFVYVADLESDIDHDTYLQRLYDQINIYGGYYTYKEIKDYIIPYIKLALANTDKPEDEKEMPEFEVNQDWELYGLEELKGMRDSYEDQLKALTRYSRSYEELVEIKREIQWLEDVKGILDSYKSGVFGNINLNNRQELTWTAENLQEYPDIVTELGVQEGDTTKIIGRWANDFTTTDAFGEEHVFSVAYTPMLETNFDEPVILPDAYIRIYINHLLEQSIDSLGRLNKSQLLELDSTGIEYEYIKSLATGGEYTPVDGDAIIRNIIAGACDYTEQDGNPMDVTSQAMQLHEINEDEEAITMIASLADIILTTDAFEDKTTDEVINDTKEIIDDMIADIEERENVDLNFVDDGTGESYEATYGRQQYVKLTEALGDEETEGTILYQIKVLEEEIADIQEEMDDIRELTNEYAIIVKYDLDNETLESLTTFPAEVIAQRRFSLFTEKELLTFETLLRDTDYVNSNILTTSIMSLDEKFQVEEELLADSEDKLSEVSQPQFVFSSSVDNFFRLTEYDDWANEFKPDQGELNKPPIGLLKYIMVGLRENYSVKLRIIGYRWNPCEITPDLTLEFSNMITSRSGRSDLTQLLDQENNRGSKNSIRIGTGTADSAQEYVAALMDLLKNNSIFVKSVKGIASGVTGTGTNTLAVENIISDYLNSHNISASQINVDNIIGLDGKFRTLTSQYIDAKYITSQIIDAETGYFKDINAIRIKTEQLDVDDLTAHIVSADNGTFTNLVAGVIEGMTIYANSITADKITGDQGQFEALFSNDIFTNQFIAKSAAIMTETTMVESVQNLIAQNISVADLKAGNIVLGTDEDPTKGIQILSKNGNMVMNGQVLQFGKENEDGEFEVNIQLGYGTDEKPSLIIMDEDGAVLFTSQGIISGQDENGNPIYSSPKGISAEAIANELIVNNMIKNNTISESKLNFSVMKQGDAVVLDQVFVEAGGDNFGTLWESFKETTESALNNLTTAAKSVSLYGQQVFVESNGTITPQSVLITAELKSGARIDKWFIDGTQVTTGISELVNNHQSITIPSSRIEGKKTLQVKVTTTEGLYDIMTLYRVVDGKDGESPYTIVLTSSKGELFKENDSTVITCTVYEGTKIINGDNAEQEHEILYCWQKWEGNDWSTLMNQTGKSITVNVTSQTIKQRIKCIVSIDEPEDPNELEGGGES